jgi:membrane associated rhomboid family serine protease
MPPLTETTRTILIINVAVYFLQQLVGPWFEQSMALWPIGPEFMPWQVVTYAFLHANIQHLFFNMLGLWMFGSELEQVWGPKRFFQFYAASVLAAAITQLVVNALLGAQAPTIGASGGIFGLLLAFALIFPERVILVFFVLPMKAKYFVAIYGLIELYQGVYVMNSGVAHFAHLGGMLGGLLTIRYWRGQPPFTRRRR